MSTALCIHGHFYQPPRQDPWLGHIPVEAGAAPFRHWDERICAESYAPLARARRLDAGGRIADILNCYAWMSFNVGPTLFAWLRRAEPGLVALMRRGDAQSLARWGHGNAMAQIYHHVIMPLATAEDRLLETRWAVADFEHHFDRKPEGMWLSECAVDLPTLETLAAEGIGFVVLAPRQAKAVLENGVWAPVNEGGLNIGSPYLVRLPSGASMTVIFYSGGLSRDIAFEGLLRDGESFWRRIVQTAHGLETRQKGTPLLSLATDGETYGHHFPFGEMALAYVLAQGYAGRDNVRLTNFAAHVAAHPPGREVRLHEPSSWSCVHGVERWRSDCGCSDGGHPGFRQQWRGPLRRALEIIREGARAHYNMLGPACFTDSATALLRYGEVLADPGREIAFAEEFYKPGKADLCRSLLAMQEHSLAAFASCAWFFDDIGRVEPCNGMAFALAALDLLKECGGPDLLPAMLAELEKAPANRGGSGADVFRAEVLPRRLDDASLVCLALRRLMAEEALPAPGDSVRCVFDRISVEISLSSPEAGTALLRKGFEERGREFAWRLSGDAGACDVLLRPADGQEICRSSRDFSHPVREFLLDLSLARQEAERAPALEEAARRALALFPRPEEGRGGFTRPENWAALLPYLPTAAAMEEKLATEVGKSLRELLGGNLGSAQRRRAEALAEERLCSALEDGTLDDGGMAAAVVRLDAVLPGMGRWRLQNTLWDLGVKKFPLLARRLGYL